MEQKEKILDTPSNFPFLYWREKALTLSYNEKGKH